MTLSTYGLLQILFKNLQSLSFTEHIFKSISIFKAFPHMLFTINSFVIHVKSWVFLIN